MHIAIVGAGIGGLVAAHALARAGEDVEVFDRDPEVSATGGYRLHLDARACAILRRRLSPDLYAALQASAAGPAAMRQFAVTDHRLRLLARQLEDPGEERLMIGRIPLRQLLATGLGERLHFGRRYTEHVVRPDQTVEVRFADGGAVVADLLVGADGVGSRVAAALAGRATSAPVGLSGIAARTPVRGDHQHLVPALLRDGPALALGPGGVGLFLSHHDPELTSAVDPAACRTVPAVREPASIVWGLIAPDDRLPDDLRAGPPERLVPVAATLLAGWAPGVHALVAACDPSSAAAYRFSATDPTGPLTPWPAGCVTALGDAVHAMPPTGGRSAATAIRDADALARRLAGVRRGRDTLATALAAYHRDLARYAPAAIVESLQPVGWITALRGPIPTALARVALPTAAAGAAAARWLRSAVAGGPAMGRGAR